jgi:hypothetical protein
MAAHDSISVSRIVRAALLQHGVVVLRDQKLSR